MKFKSPVLRVVCGLLFVSPMACEPARQLLNRLTLQKETRKEVPPPIQAPDTPEKAASIAKGNSELLSEVYKVVFNEEEIDDKADFGSLAHSLNEGASLEGIYRGLIMGSRYRALESKAQGASPSELKAFAAEMTELQSVMRNPTVFTSSDRKAPVIEYPDGTTGSANTGSPQTSGTLKKDKSELTSDLLRTFIGASLFTLKRVLGDEALLKFEEDKDDRGNLAQWYAALVVRLSSAKVDFGLELRNKPDFDFHFKFAQTMANDRVKWEVLNRYHRYLNSVGKSR